jgi:plastocyanin
VRLRALVLGGSIVALALSSAVSPRAVQRGSGSIRGLVALNRLAAPAEGRPSVSALGMTATRDLSERLRSVVYLETAPRGAFEQNQRARAVMDQRNETFVPHVLAVRTGSIVDFPNNDRIYHNVFSLSPTRRFDLGRYAVGRSKAVRFDRPGVVRVFCDIHSHMNAFIVVFAHRFFVVPQPDGEYVLPPVPPGTYTVSGWYEGEVRASRQITVGTGDTAVVDIASH